MLIAWHPRRRWSTYMLKNEKKNKNKQTKKEKKEKELIFTE